YLDDLFTKGRAEPNAEKRKALVHDIQRHTAKKAYMIRWPGGASGFSLRWPTVRNYNVVKDDLRGDIMSIWLDPSLPPNRPAWLSKVREAGLRVGFSLPFSHADKTAYTHQEIMGLARALEDAGFAGVWIGDVVG